MQAGGVYTLHGTSDKASLKIGTSESQVRQKKTHSMT